MKAHRLFTIGVTTLVLTVSSLLQAAEGDAEWQKVTDAIENVKNPKEKPASREDAMAKLKAGVTDFDAAHAAALKAAPSHPARWDAALFHGMIARARDMVKVPAPATPVPSLEDVQKAADAKPETRSMAGVVDLMETADEATSAGGDVAAWTAKAEKQLKDYPAEQMNRMVESRLKSIKALADVNSKPLDLKFTAVDGREVDLSKMQGKVVLIDFWATWCGPCVAELPNVLKTYKALHPKGFEIVGISLDSDKGKLEAFVKDKGMDWPQYYDGKAWQNEISSKYGISSIPAMWLVNKKGMVVNRDARDGLEKEVEKLLAE